MKLIVIHNPAAGRTEWSAQRVRQLVRDAGHTAEVISADDDWHASLNEQPDAFVAAGGDGTVHDVVFALVDRAIPVAILPLGTANNVAHALGYRVEQNLVQRVKCWQDNQQILRIGSVDAGSKRQLFIESVGAGAFARMRKASDGTTKKSVPALGLVAIRRKLIETLLAAKPLELALQIDGQAMAGEFLSVECLRLSFHGPRLWLAPRQTADAALLSVCAVPVAEREAAAQWMASGIGDPERWLLGRGTVIELQTREWTHVDGDLWPSKRARTGRLHIQSAARSVRVMV